MPPNNDTGEVGFGISTSEDHEMFGAANIGYNAFTIIIAINNNALILLLMIITCQCILNTNNNDILLMRLLIVICQLQRTIIHFYRILFLLRWTLTSDLLKCSYAFYIFCEFYQSKNPGRWTFRIESLLVNVAFNMFTARYFCC